MQIVANATGLSHSGLPHCNTFRQTVEFTIITVNSMQAHMELCNVKESKKKFLDPNPDCPKFYVTVSPRTVLSTNLTYIHNFRPILLTNQHTEA